MSQSVCIIIVTYNAEKWLLKSIDRLIDIPGGCNLLVVDNGSTDLTCDILQNNYPQINLIRCNSNLGFGQANNLGIKEAIRFGYSWLLLLNQDAYISWENINKLVEVAKSNANYGIVSPIHLYSDLEIDFTHRKHILGKNEELLSDFLLTGSCKEIYEYKITNAAIWLLPRITIELVGGFDPLFFHYGEDNDYCLRTIKKNLKVGICPKVIGYHYRPQDDSNYIKNQNYYYVEYLLKLIHHQSSLNQIYIRIIKQVIMDTIRIRIGLNKLRYKIIALYKVISSYSAIKSRRKESHKYYRYL